MKNIVCSLFVLVAACSTSAFAADLATTSGSEKAVSQNTASLGAKTESQGEEKKVAVPSAGTPSPRDDSALGRVTPPLNALKVPIQSEEGFGLGYASLKQTADRLSIRLELTGMTAGIYTVRLHEVALCEPETGFLSAGKKIGASDASLKIEFEDFEIAADGKGKVDFSSVSLVLSASGKVENTDKVVLLDDDNSSIVVYRKKPAAADAAAETDKAGSSQNKASEMDPVACGLIKAAS